MLPTAHFFTGIAFLSLISYFNIIPNDSLLSLLVVAAFVLPDADIVLSSMHRNLFTHTPAFWVCIAAVGFFISRSLWFLTPALVFHMLLDTFDYGLMLAYPFSRKKFGIAVLGKNSAVESKSSVAYVREYLRNPTMRYMEITIMLIAMLALILPRFF